MDRLDDLVRELRASAQATDEAEAPPASPAVGAAARRRQGSRAKQVGRAGRARASGIGTGTRWRKPLLIGGGVVVGIIGVLMVLPQDNGAELTSVTPVPHTVASASAVPERHTVIDTPTAFLSAPTPLQWLAVVQQLDRRRGFAFMQGEQAEVFTVNALQSPALESDLAMVNALIAAGAHADGFPLRVKSVREEYLTLGERQPRAMLTIVDTLGAYNLVDAKGRVLRRIPARGERTWHVELERSVLYGWVYVSALNARST